MKTIKQIIVLCCVCLFFPNLNAQNFSSCDQWATFTDNGFNVYNNIWGSGAGSQCLWANSFNNWGVSANHPDTGGVKSYPNVSSELSLNVSQLGSCNSSFNVTHPGNSGSYASAYDIWYNNHAYELMLWMNWHGAVSPISYSYDSTGNPVPEAQNVTVGGNTWNVYRGTNGANEVFSFLRTSMTNSASVDITAISNWIRNRGWFGDANLHKIEFGFEITASSGGLDFSVNNYSLSCQEGSGGGGGNGDEIVNGTYVIQAGHSGKAMTVANASSEYGANIEQSTYTGGGHQQWQVTSLADGYYSIINVNSGLSLDVWELSLSNGANIAQWGYWGGDNQQWSLVNSGNGSYQIVSRLSGQALDVEGAASADGANILQWPVSGSANQQWSFSLQ